MQVERIHELPPDFALLERILADARRSFPALGLRTDKAAPLYEKPGFRAVNDETATHLLEWKAT